MVAFTGSDSNTESASSGSGTVSPRMWISMSASDLARRKLDHAARFLVVLPFRGAAGQGGEGDANRLAETGSGKGDDDRSRWSMP